LEIVVLDRQSDKLIRMEVQPRHTIGSIIETIVDKQKLGKNQKYRLALGNQSFGKEQYLLKVKDAGISQGDHLFLEAETIAPEIHREPKFCGNCGKPLRAGAKFCLECGAPVIEETKKEEKKAEQLCNVCGSKLKWIQQYQRWYCYKCHKYT